jgi:hypothetical protein
MLEHDGGVRRIAAATGTAPGSHARGYGGVLQPGDATQTHPSGEAGPRGLYASAIGIAVPTLSRQPVVENTNRDAAALDPG